MNRFQRYKATGAAITLAGLFATQMALAPFLLTADQKRPRSVEVTYAAMSFQAAKSTNWGWG